MRRFVICSCSIWIVFAALTASGCSNSSQNTSVIAPTPVSITATFPFQAGSAGLITSTLTTLGPDSTLSIGLSLGTWNGTACAVSIIHNDNAGQGSSIVGQATSSGSLCTRVYDVGNITEGIAYKITVVHP